MEKATILIKDQSVDINIPIVKANIDVERRIVSGWATIDNVDQMDDKVSAEASLNAFSQFRGNVREMHDKTKAVGRVVNFRQEDFIGKDGAKHTGIYVDVYVSKGAEDTWQKVLDGTLAAFSIKGPIKEVSKQYLANHDRLVQIVTDYQLIELSLVDNPGNELCNVVSVQKSNEGIAANVEINNVFWCEEDKIAFASDNELSKCSFCSEEMENVGWFEPTDEVPTKDSITKILQAGNKLEKTLQEPKGGSEMTEKNEEVQEVVEQVATPEDVVEEVKAPEVVEAEEVVEPDLASISKALEDIQATIVKASDTNRTETLSEIQKAVSAVETGINEKLAELQKGYAKLEDEVKTVKDGLGNVEKSLSEVTNSIEKSSAGSKSITVESGEMLEKSGDSKEKGFWSGGFLPSYDQD